MIRFVLIFAVSLSVLLLSWSLMIFLCDGFSLRQVFVGCKMADFYTTTVCQWSSDHHATCKELKPLHIKVQIVSNLGSKLLFILNMVLHSAIIETDSINQSQNFLASFERETIAHFSHIYRQNRKSRIKQAPKCHLDWSWNNFYGHSLPLIQEGLLSVTRESICARSTG